ncbi:MAG: bifunctional aspartate kinase/homoserine dehydrogenase I [Saprospiraceae bacterium]|nr:bifunctional aspartate kinase/homoserine dehydrogenase I [Saprospiraceae bacterium]
MLVLKFGGTSVASAENIIKVKDILTQKSKPFLVVVSAFSGTTDKLQKIAELSLLDQQSIPFNELKDIHSNIAKELIDLPDHPEVLIYIQKQFNKLNTLCNGINALQELSDKTLAKVMSFGEILSSYIIHKYLIQNGISIDLIDSRKMIKTKGEFLKGELVPQSTYPLISQLDSENNYIAPGFISSNINNEILLLGRGGSDYTAAIYAAGMEVDRLEIWSDVNGMLSANPKIVKAAKTINSLSYKEAFELSHFGANVLYAPTIRPVMQKSIPVYLKNTFQPKVEGTFIGNIGESNNEGMIKGISSISGLSILTISGVGMAGIKGTARRIFLALEIAEVNVVLITQCCSEQSICIGVNENEASAAVNSLMEEFEKEIKRFLIDEIVATSDYAVVALVGDNMKLKVGLSGKVFGALGNNGINIIAIAQGASERNISVVINKKDEKKALNVLHERFFSDMTKKIHLFITGIGNVGSKFLNIIKTQQKLLLDERKIDIKIIAIINSKKMILDENGIDLNKNPNPADHGVDYQNFSDVIDKMVSLNLRNSIFIDNTASATVSSFYSTILNKSISVIACNKIACSDKYIKYAELIQLSKDKNCHFKYETTVGAALPIIKTIQNLVLSGDKILKIKAVLSGSLNFIFNNYNNTNTFVEIVKQARDEGYTEPDPLIDLSGVDVMRKILILSREAKHHLEMSDVIAKPFLPDNCLNANSVENLFKELESSESHFRNLYNLADQKGHKLKVVATFENGIASVGLEEVDVSSPFYNLEGKDNIVSINSDRYPIEPLVVKGAGAGAEVTASGVFSDLMLIINK